MAQMITAQTQFMTDAGNVHVDTAVELGQFAVERFNRQGFFAHHLAGMAHQHFKQVEFGAGQLQRNIFD